MKRMKLRLLALVAALALVTLAASPALANNVDHVTGSCTSVTVFFENFDGDGTDYNNPDGVFVVVTGAATGAASKSHAQLDAEENDQGDNFPDDFSITVAIVTVTPGGVVSVKSSWESHNETKTFTAPLNCNDTESVTLCHATSSESNPYTTITVDAAGAYNGHLVDHDGDIVPEFIYLGESRGPQGDQSLLQYPDCDKPDVEVTATAPSFTDPDCDTEADISIPETEGVTYSQEGDVEPGGTVTVTATAQEGFVLVGETEWTHTYAEVPAEDICNPPPPPVDVCPNIEGLQESVPEGYAVNNDGQCVPIVTPPPTTPPPIPCEQTEEGCPTPTPPPETGKVFIFRGTCDNPDTFVRFIGSGVGMVIVNGVSTAYNVNGTLDVDLGNVEGTVAASFDNDRSETTVSYADCPTPTPSPTPTPTEPPSPTPTHTLSPPPPSKDGGSAEGSGGGTAYTGADIAKPLIGFGLLLLLGIVSFWLRRKTLLER